MTSKGCPFCGSSPYAPTQYKKKKSYTGCSNSSCPIFGRNINTEKWDTRPLEEQLEAELKQYKDALKKEKNNGVL